jgi:hypothetical protein
MSENDPWTEAGNGSGNELDVIYHNMRVTSNFRTLRQQRFRTVEHQLQILARQIEAGCFDVIISVSASKGSFVVVMETSLSDDELFSKGFPDS